MAIYHYHMQSIGRNIPKEGVSASADGNGNIGTKKGGKVKPNRSAVFYSAYIARCDLMEKIYDKESGIWFEKPHAHSHKKDDIAFSKIFAPKNAASWMLDRQELWNRIQNEFDRARNSVFAKEMDIALPRELDVEQNIELMTEFVEDVLVAYGLIADANFHNDNPNNPHFHVMTSTRHIISSKDGSESTFEKKIRDIDHEKFLYYLRSTWASYVNKHLEKHGFAERIDCRSYKDQGINIIPTIHEGVGGHLRGSDRARINAEIIQARALQVVADPSQIAKLLGIEKSYFTLSAVEDKVASIILDDKISDGFVISDNVSSTILDSEENQVGSIQDQDQKQNDGHDKHDRSYRVLDKNLEQNVSQDRNVSQDQDNISVSFGEDADKMDPFGVLLNRDMEGNILLDSEGYNKLSEVRLSVVSTVLGSDMLVKLDGLSELGEYYTTRERIDAECRFLNLAQDLSGISGTATATGAEVDIDISKDRSDISLLYRDLDLHESELLKAPCPVKKFVKTKEQQSVVRSLIEGGLLTQLYGYAGTGKSMVLSSVREVYEGRGVLVVGIAPTAKSRWVLADLGIEAQTLYSLRSREEWVEGILVKIESGRSLECTDWEMSFARNYRTPFTANTVFMLDEASMVDLDIYSWVIEKSSLSGAKLISIGDYNQLPVVKGMGGGFRALVDNFADKTFSLSEIWRQKDPVYKDITKCLASYKVSDALLLLKEKKPDVCKFIDGDRRDSELRLVSDYVAWFKEQNSLRDRVRESSLFGLVSSIKYELCSSLGYAMDGGFIDASRSGVIISYLRSDITRLNRLVREDLYLSGILENKVFESKVFENEVHKEGIGIGRDFVFRGDGAGSAVGTGVMVARGKIDSPLNPISLLLGEQIMFLKNDKRAGLYNGEIGIILDIRESVSSLDKNVAGQESLNPAFYDILVRIHRVGGNSTLQWFNSKTYGHFDYGYASTVHKVQGDTSAKVFLDFSKYMGFEAFYVAVTRHEEELSIYLNKEELVSILDQRYGISRSEGLSEISGISGANIVTGLKGAEGDERNLYFAALEAFVSRRSSDIFVSEFAGKGRSSGVNGSDRDNGSDVAGRSISSSEGIFAEYHEIRNKAASLYREMSLEVQSRNLGRIWSHSRWGEFKDLTSKRNAIAKVIVSDMERFEVCLKITKANMSVIRDHAGVTSFGVEKIYGNAPSNSSMSDSVRSDTNKGTKRSLERSALLAEYRNICDIQIDALYRGVDGSTDRSVILSNLLSEASGLGSSQRTVSDEIERLSGRKIDLTQQIRVISQDIESCSSRLGNISDGLRKIYSSEPGLVAQKFGEYLKESGVSFDELSHALKYHEISDNVRRLELRKVDLARFGEVRGNEYNLGLFKLAGFDRRQNLSNREFVVSNIVEYLNSLNNLDVLSEKRSSTLAELENLMSSYDKDMERLGSKFLGSGALNHLEKIAYSRDVLSLSKWLESPSASKCVFAGYEMIRKESVTEDMVSGVDRAEKDREFDFSGNQAQSLKWSELRELKGSLLSRIDPVSIARFFESNRVGVGAGDEITIKSGVLKCGSFHLHLSGEKAGQWYRFSRSEGGDIYRLAESLGVSGKTLGSYDNLLEGSSGSNVSKSDRYRKEWNNFKVVASFVGIDAEKIIAKSSGDVSTGIDSEVGEVSLFGEISKEIQNMKIQNISGIGGDYAPSYKDKWEVLARVPSGARGFDVLEEAPYLVKGLERRARIYDYKDIDGNLIGHMVRAERADGAKALYPISYCINREIGEVGWRVKGFSAGSIIYGAEKLGTSAGKPILIVEGEKTCEVAQKLLGSEYVVISWSAGSSVCGKVDWSPLAGREVVIWPDADAPGVKAAGLIEGSLRENNIDIKSLNIIDVRSLGLVDGWDVAEKLPKHLEKFSVKDIITDSSPAIDHARALLDKKIGAIEFGCDSGLTKLGKIGVLNDISSLNLQKAGLWSTKYQERLTHELSVVKKSDALNEFVLASNVVKYCKTHDISVGIGRGSAVGSLTAYALGIHSVDPIKYNLSFERFLSEGKSTIPDFDIDVSSKDREKVVDYLFQALGGRVVLMSTIDDKRHPSGVVILPDGMDMEEAVSRGLCSFALVSPSGYPIMKSDRSFKDLEKLGFRKIDILGSNVLDKITDTIEAINEKYGSSVNFAEVEKYAMSDKETYSLIARGDTDGIFQLESESAKKICERVIPEKFEDVVNILALNRPGTGKFVDLFGSRGNGKGNNGEHKNHNFKIFDPRGVFAKTRGWVLFQEQVMEAGVKYFGVQEKDSDAFRRDLEKDLEGRIVGNKDVCIKRAMELDKNLTKVQAESLYSSLEKFAKFGYNKSHAVAYAKTTIVSAYLKAHYREEFHKHFGIQSSAQKISAETKSKFMPEDAAKSPFTRFTYGSLQEFENKVKHLAEQKNICLSAEGLRNFVWQAKEIYITKEFDKDDNNLGYQRKDENGIDIFGKNETISRLQYYVLDRCLSARYILAHKLIDKQGEFYRETGEKNYSNTAAQEIEMSMISERIGRTCLALGGEVIKEEDLIARGKNFMDTQEIESLRESKIDLEFKHNKLVLEFAKDYGALAARYLAEQLVDYKIYNAWKDDGKNAGKEFIDNNLNEHSNQGSQNSSDLTFTSSPTVTSRCFEIMKNVAYEQSLLEVQMRESLGLHHNEGGIHSHTDGSTKASGSRVLTTEIFALDREAAIKLSTTRLRTEMTVTIHELGVEKLDIARAQNMRNMHASSAISELVRLQKDYISERGKEIEQDLLSKSKDRGIDR